MRLSFPPARRHTAAGMGLRLCTRPRPSIALLFPISSASRSYTSTFNSSSSARLGRISCIQHHNQHPHGHRPFHTSLNRPRTQHQRHLISEGRNTELTNLPHDADTPSPPPSPSSLPKYYLETAYSIFAKRPSRPFPPPFLSLPSGSFSDPLTNHTRARARHPSVHGQTIKGVTNGDDALVIGLDGTFLCVNDGVGQWAQKEKGHAALWARLIAHFWVVGLEAQQEGGKGETREGKEAESDMIAALQGALEQTVEVTKTNAGDIQGTTTASGALLRSPPSGQDGKPVLLAANVGDCAVWVVRPGNEDAVYKSKEQWHWFDCPRQLGTNSPDQPREVGVCDTVEVEVGDVVLCVSDGVTDNLWENEICDKVTECLGMWERGEEGEAQEGVLFLARELMKAARVVAEDPDAGSPYMERALDEGIPAEGGKLDDISVVVGVVRKRGEENGG